MADYFFEDESIAVQLALWRSRGKTREEIEESYIFNHNDWNLSYLIMNY